MAVMKTPREWEQITGIRVLDPDGWRGRNRKSFLAEISHQEFMRRVNYSTCEYACEHTNPFYPPTDAPFYPPTHGSEETP